MKIGIVDIGSNTVRLVIYRYRDNKITKLINKKYTLSLVSYVKKRSLSIEGIDVLIEAINSFKEILIDFKINDYDFFATASLRNIDNTDEVLNFIKDKTNINIKVLSKEEEGRFNYLGIKHDLLLDEGIIIDIGGGSSETVYFKDDKIIFNESMSIGSLNLYMNNVNEIIPTNQEIENLNKIINSYLSSLPKDKNIKKAIGVGGSIRAMFTYYNTLYEKKEYLDREDVNKIIKSICTKKGMKHFLQIKPERMHTVIPGLLILKGIMKKYKIEQVTLSSTGLKEGYLLEKIKV